MRTIECVLVVPSLCLAVASVAVAQPQDAQAALEQLVNTYQQQGPWQVQTDIKVKVRSQGQEGESEVDTINWIGDAHGRAVANFRGYTTRIEPDQVTVIHEDTEGRFFQRALPNEGANAATAVRDLWLSLPDPHVELLLSKEPGPDMFAPLDLAQGQLQLEAFQVQKNDQGEVTDQTIVFSGSAARLELLIDPESGLLKSSVLTITGEPKVPDGSSLIYEQTHRVEAVDANAVDEALRFSPERRRRTDLLAALAPGAQMEMGVDGQVVVGQPAPAMLLPMLTGPLVDLAELRGEIVVVDFWATWCGPCRRALPHLQEVAQWARQEDKPVIVLAVNTMERQGGVQRRDAIDAVWDQLGLDLTVLLDEGSRTAQAWGVSGIPSTFVIDREGEIIAHHRGFSPDIAQTLRREIEASLTDDG